MDRIKIQISHTSCKANYSNHWYQMMIMISIQMSIFYSAVNPVAVAVVVIRQADKTRSCVCLLFCGECRICPSVHACRCMITGACSLIEWPVFEATHFHPVQRVTVILWPLCSQGFSLHKAHFVTVNRPRSTAGLQ